MRPCGSAKATSIAPEKPAISKAFSAARRRVAGLEWFMNTALISSRRDKSGGSRRYFSNSPLSVSA